jgi:nitroreductase
MSPLEIAAQASLHAPSVFNTQPWRWEISGDTMELLADATRRIDSTDRDGRLLALSCGAALHHARVALAANGWTASVDRLPDPARPELVARVTLGAPAPADPLAQRLAGAIPQRRTDRRAFGERPVLDTDLTGLRKLVEAEGAYLHTVRADQVVTVALAAEAAGAAELDDPAYRAELAKWTHRAAEQGDGVPASVAVEAALRRVPVREFAPDGAAGLMAGADHDQGAAYVVLFGEDVRPANLVRGGEALSALLLAATADGLATAPQSEPVEVEWPRHLMHGLLAGIGEPYVLVRLGYRSAGDPLPPRPRRAAADVITVL